MYQWNNKRAQLVRSYFRSMWTNSLKGFLMCMVPSFCTNITKQESPPAWTQEAYRPPCSEYYFCCPTRVPPPGGYLTRVPPPGGGYPDPPRGGTRTPRGVPGPPRGGTWPGYPPGGVPDPGPPGGYPDPPGGTWPGYPRGGTRTPRGYLTQVPPGGVPGPPGGGYLTRVPPPPPGGYPDPPSPPVWTDKQSETITFPSYYVRGR